jgi:type II restriction enzyme
MDAIAPSGRIALIEKAQARPKSDVLYAWRNTIFLRDKNGMSARSWLMSVMRCVDTFGARSFGLKEIYSFESSLAKDFPSNRNVRAKIRQQLQVLRDHGYIEFLGDGLYRRL